jgi:hypothetical protein
MKKQINEEISSMKFLLNYKRGIVISEQAAAVNTTPSVYAPSIGSTTNTTTDWSKYPCVVKHPKAKKGKTPKGSEFYQIDNYNYYNNGKKWNIVVKIVQNYTCNDPEFKTNVSTLGDKVNQKTPIPSELKNIEGVKLFQDWLDLNAQDWATGFTNGKLNKGTGYGNFGPRTQKAWNTYGRRFLSGGDMEEMKPITNEPNSKLKPITNVPLQSAQNPAPTVNRGVNQLKPQ